MIRGARGNFSMLLVVFAAPRPATTTLAVAATWTIGLSMNLHRATPVLPIAVGRSSTPTLSIASAKRVQRTSDTARRRRNPHSV